MRLRRSWLGLLSAPAQLLGRRARAARGANGPDERPEMTRAASAEAPTAGRNWEYPGFLLVVESFVASWAPWSAFVALWSQWRTRDGEGPDDLDGGQPVRDPDGPKPAPLEGSDLSAGCARTDGDAVRPVSGGRAPLRLVRGIPDLPAHPPPNGSLPRAMPISASDMRRLAR